MGASRSSTLALVSSIGVSACLIVAAFFTVQHAGCDDPGHVVIRSDGVVELVGGCIAAGDLAVPGAPADPATTGSPPSPGVRP